VPWPNDNRLSVLSQLSPLSYRESLRLSGHQKLQKGMYETLFIDLIESVMQVCSGREK